MVGWKDTLHVPSTPPNSLAPLVTIPLLQLLL